MTLQHLLSSRLAPVWASAAIITLALGCGGKSVSDSSNQQENLSMKDVTDGGGMTSLSAKDGGLSPETSASAAESKDKKSSSLATGTTELGDSMIGEGDGPADNGADGDSNTASTAPKPSTASSTAVASEADAAVVVQMLLPAEPEPAALPSDAGADGGVFQLIVDDLTVLVIFDNSGSMDTFWEGTSRWEAANLALHAAIEPVMDSLKVGAIRFPSGGECEVPDFDSEVQFGFTLGAEFLTRWDAEGQQPGGGTPLAQAFLAADTAMANALEQGLLDERFRVLVVTDGEPNCESDPDLLTALPAKWLERGVETHVLGLPGSGTATALLDSIAAAGGGHHRALQTTTELTEEVTILTR